VIEEIFSKVTRVLNVPATLKNVQRDSATIELEFKIENLNFCDVLPAVLSEKELMIQLTRTIKEAHEKFVKSKRIIEFVEKLRDFGRVMLDPDLNEITVQFDELTRITLSYNPETNSIDEVKISTIDLRSEDVLALLRCVRDQKGGPALLDLR